jgi:hypothetical protein
LGCGGRQFESGHPDKYFKAFHDSGGLFCFEALKSLLFISVKHKKLIFALQKGFEVFASTLYQISEANLATPTKAFHIERLFC